MHLGFNNVIATPSLSLPGHDDSSRYPMYGSPIWMVSGRILELCLRSNIEYHWIGLGRYREHASLDEWLYNSGAQQFIVCHFFIVGAVPT